MQSQCGAGRRRKSAGRRKTRRGGGYGVGAAISPGALEYVANNTSAVGTIRPGNNLLGARRRKSSKKAGRRRRSTKRGGGSVSTVGYGYTGTGDRGLANVTGYNANPPGPVGYMGHQ
jgi:hypothetical protein